MKKQTQRRPLALKHWVVLTKETQAASRRIRTMRSSNCSTTNSHRDFPERDTSHTLRQSIGMQYKGSVRCVDLSLEAVVKKDNPVFTEKGGEWKTAVVYISKLNCCST